MGSSVDATSQAHGKAFERLIRDSGRFPGAIGSKSSETDAIDIEACYDEPFDLHTSVKMTGDGWIGLADAIRFYEMDRPFRIIAGRWIQFAPTMKRVTVIHEVVVTLKTLARLKGRLTLERIREMHGEYASFPAGPHGKAEAKKAADRMLLASRNDTGLVRLDFKGDDRAQRRLQLSITLPALVNAVNDDPLLTYRNLVTPTSVVERSWYHSLPLPLDIPSPGRRFRNPATAPQANLALIEGGLPTVGVQSMAPRLVTRQDDIARAAAAIAANPSQPRLIA